MEPEHATPGRTIPAAGGRPTAKILQRLVSAAAILVAVSTCAGNGGSGADVSAPSGNAQLIPEPLPAPELCQQVFFCDFEMSPTECGFHEQAKSPPRASIVDVGRSGARSVRLHTQPGDRNVAGSGSAERNDLTLSQEATGCYAGAEQVWEHSILFPDDFTAPSNIWYVVADFHNTDLGPGQANFHVDASRFDGPTLWLRGYAGQQRSETFNVRLARIVKNEWYDFVYHVKWSSGSDGFFKAWVNGVLMLAHRGPTLYEGQGCYLKLANYHAAFGQASSVLHDRIIRRDVTP